jgi:chemotaxis protein methyltransferase CheR
MSTTINERDGIRHVMVQGEELAEREERHLLQVIGSGGVPVHLRLYELKWLSPALAFAINRLLGLDPRNRVSVYNSQLYGYLSRLGLDVRIVQEESLQSGAGRQFRALAIGGSADSLEKILAVIDRLPLSQMVLFIVQHVSDEQPNLLDQILRRRTPCRVVMPHHLETITPGTIYVAPPGHHLKVAHGLVYLTQDRKINSARPSIDALFDSVAAEYGSEALGLLLCGFGRDGVDGARAMLERGAEMLVLDPDECPTAKGMVEQAQGELPEALVVSLAVAVALVAATTVVAGEEPETGVIDAFFAAVARRYGYDYRNYNADMLARRLKLTGQKLGSTSHYACQRELLTSPAAFERLFLSLSINVTSFFRMPSQFRLLRNEVIPRLASLPRIKIWIAGCSSGEEVYSLAIVLQETGLIDRAMIYATDINPFVLLEARNGLYGSRVLGESRINYQAAGGEEGGFERYIEQQGSLFSIAPELKVNVLFHRHSLVGDGPFNEFNLIICRNLLIYFNKELQGRVMELFDRSLHRNGMLLLGEKEELTPGQGARFFKVLNGNQSLYLHK